MCPYFGFTPNARLPTWVVIDLIPCRWYEVYTLVRRLMLTSVPVALDTLAQSTIYVISVSVVTLVLERECSPYINLYISAFSYVLHWQIVMVVLFLLLKDSQMMSTGGELLVGVVLLISNIVLSAVVFVDTRIHDAEEKASHSFQQFIKGSKNFVTSSRSSLSRIRVSSPPRFRANPSARVSPDVTTDPDAVSATGGEESAVGSDEDGVSNEALRVALAEANRQKDALIALKDGEIALKDEEIALKDEEIADLRQELARQARVMAAPQGPKLEPLQVPFPWAAKGLMCSCEVFECFTGQGLSE